MATEHQDSTLDSMAPETGSVPVVDSTPAQVHDLIFDSTIPSNSLPPSLLIEEGFVIKRGPLPLRLWQKRYFRLPAENLPYPLNKLRVVYRKSVKKIHAPKDEFEKSNRFLLDTLATATVNSTSILAYYKSEDKDELPQGFINLKHVLEISPSPKIKPFAFTIKTKSRDFVFSTNAQKDTDAWVSTLKYLSNSDIPDFSDTAAYQFSYSLLADRKDFASPSAPTHDDEVFSASEPELEQEDVATKSTELSSAPKPLTIDVPQSDSPTADSKPATIKDEPNGSTSPRKSFYTEVLDFFYRKSSEHDTTVPQAGDSKEVSTSKPVDESASKSEKVIEVPAPVEQVSKPTEIVAQEPVEAPVPEIPATPVADTVVEAPVSTPAEPSTDANNGRPSRSKTFVLPKFEGKIFKIFKKNGEQVASKEPGMTSIPSVDEIVSEPDSRQCCDLPVSEPTVVEEAVSVHNVTESEPVPEPIAELIVPSEEPVPEPEVKEVEPVALSSIEEPIPVVSQVISEEIIQTVETEATPIVEDVEDKVIETTHEAVVAFEASPEEAAPSEVKEDKQPFIKRILSGKRKSKVVESPVADIPAVVPVEEVVVNESVSEPVQTKSVPEVIPTNVVSEVVVEEVIPEAKEVAPEPVPEVSTTQVETETEPVPKQPFIKRLLSGNLKGKSEAASSAEVAPEPTPETIMDSSVVVAEPEVAATESITETAVIEEPAVEDAKPEASSEVEATEAKTEEDADKKDEIPAPQRQTSLFGRIGELAYSAVAPTTAGVPEETEEDISEHYTDKIKNALQSGFLYKQSNLLHTNNLRYFILGKDGVVTYFRSVKVASEGKKVVINDETEVSPFEDLLITIKSPSGTIYNFQAKTQEDRDAWYDAIRPFAKAQAPVEADKPSFEESIEVSTADAEVAAEPASADTNAVTVAKEASS